MTVTFGLGYRKDSPRIDVATQPYPGRWTHHVMVGSAEEIDEERAKRARERAEERLRTKTPETDILRAETALQRAMARIHVIK